MRGKYAAKRERAGQKVKEAHVEGTGWKPLTHYIARVVGSASVKCTPPGCFLCELGHKSRELRVSRKEDVYGNA